MPHFIIECNKDTTKFVDEMLLVQKVYDVSLVAGEDHDFIHVWGYIREGRTDEQKKTLSEDIVATLKAFYPDAYLVSCDIHELDEASYIKIQL